MSKTLKFHIALGVFLTWVNLCLSAYFTMEAKFLSAFLLALFSLHIGKQTRELYQQHKQRIKHLKSKSQFN